MMSRFRNNLAAVVGLAVSAAVLMVTGAGPGAATAAPKAKEQVFEAKFECAIPSGSTSCAVAADKQVPASRRLRLEYIKARLVIPVAAKTGFDFYVDYGDPSAAGGVGTIHATPQFVSRTEGGFFNIYTIDEKVQTFAYRTVAYPAPKVRLNNPTGDPLNLQNGTIQDGVLGGTLVGLE